jgi:two-component system, cell cycle response regulator DivK
MTEPVIYKILIIEDNEMNRDMLARRLEHRGFEVFAAEDGRKGLAAARTQVPDMILLDMSLPEMDGWEVARSLKRDPATRNVPVIALTAHAMPGDREAALNVGCEDYDTKPVEIERLLGKMKPLLEKDRRNQTEKPESLLDPPTGQPSRGEQ